MIKGLQLIGVLAGLFLLVKSYRNYKNKIYSYKKFIFFAFLWSILTILFINPSLTLYLLPILTTTNTVTSIIILSLLFLFLFTSYIYQEIITINRKMTIIVQKIALSEGNNDE